MIVAYRPSNGRVLRVLRDEIALAQYRPGFAFGTVELENAANGALLAALIERPARFVYDDVDDTFVEDGESPTPRGAPALAHWARVAAFNPGTEKPLCVKRNWHGADVEVNCYVSQGVKDAYLGGTLAIDDFVLVVFVEGEIDKPLAVEKIVKTW